MIQPPIKKKTAPKKPTGPVGPRLTPRQRLEYRFMRDQMLQFEWDLRHAVLDGRIVPSAWHGLLANEPPQAKTRVTIRLDADLVKFFRSYGTGWQPLLNSVLRAYLKARMASLIDGPESLESLLAGIGERPEIGRFEKLMFGDDAFGGEDDEDDGEEEDDGETDGA